MEQDYTEIVEKVQAELDKKKVDESYVPELPKGVILDAEFPDGFYFMRPCLQEFMSHGYPADRYDTFFGGTVEAGKPAWGPGWSNPNWDGELPEGLPASLHVVSQVRRVGTRTARATAPTRHRFKQYLFGNPSHRLVRNGKIELHTNKVLNNIDELIEKERQGILSVHHKDGRRVNLLALKNHVEGDDIFAPARPAAPQPNFPLDSAANDTPSGIPFPTYIEGTFDGDPAADRALDHMRKDKATEFTDDEEDDKTVLDPALDDSLDEEDELEEEEVTSPGTEVTEKVKSEPVQPEAEGASSESTEAEESTTSAATEAAETAVSEEEHEEHDEPESTVSSTAQTQPAATHGKGKRDKKGRR